MEGGEKDHIVEEHLGIGGYSVLDVLLNFDKELLKGFFISIVCPIFPL